MEKLVVVTGASRGIGAAIARQLAADGFHVGCISRSGTLPTPRASLSDAERLLIPVAADVARPDELRAAIDELCSRGLEVRGLINNAGLLAEAPSAEMPLEQWDETMQVNARSVVVGCQAIYPYLQQGNGGLIVNMGSFFDKVGSKRNLAYSASKAAVGAITRVLAVEWAKDRIAVINIAPGFVLTDLNREHWEKDRLRGYFEKRIPGGTPGQPADIAELASALFAMNSTFLTGETIYMDGAQSISP
ncbi:SDR family oxidoreductase [Luminiphilus sp.]|nr:SDR family oxidoreductase [Luminiphilus sp.]MDA9987859.1 SDR family oxidoreductase [Luminiphilus sp.]